MHPPDRFTCEEVFGRLDDYLDRELTAEEMRLVREHLETCAACASEHRFESRVISDIRSKLSRIAAPPSLREDLQRLAVPADLMARINARIAADAAREQDGG
jgi:mycothiol system anti-sigma-R factor